MTQYVQLSADTTTVMTWYAGPQSVTSDKPGFAEIPDDDSRYVTYVALQAATQSYKAAMAAGVVITSTGTPGLNGTYAIAQANITSEQVYIAATGKFTNGGTTRAWPDASGAFHIFPTPATFTAFAEAVAGYVDALSTAIAVAHAGGAWSAPPMPAAIP